ncbi:MAG: NAD(P)(+) transhydrogenase (Re/Si-specific) subunit beta [Pirellulaceae bacterium]|nr:NAD(P)(+) transhydrogenase (Re/Si-specific) subunit beta [Pirellulaceae bacterium]
MNNTLNVLVQLSYILASALFIIGLKKMSHPRTAVRGNLLGSLGMLVAIVATLAGVVRFEYILLGVLIGSVAGAWMALKIPMTAMPQMVGLLNGFGGGASVLVAWAELLRGEVAGVDQSVMLIATAASGIIGAVTFWGSLVAYGKLQELKAFKKPVSLPGQQMINALLLLLALALSAWLVVADPAHGPWIYVAIVVVTSVLGVFLVNPIGGADMPVVIALLNSYSGLAACATGFVINNSVLIIAGSLVGASGIILSEIMCKAMNRSLANVLFGVMEAGSLAGSADEFYATVRSTTADDIAILLDGAQRVVFVPGYGMAVAQAQHAVRDLGNLIEERGGTVEYAIHPVAGRMPGHMNVLLAEADVDYEKLKEMDQINPTMGTVDVAIVIGANDVVNPLAKTDPNCPIAGMPVIDVDKARTVVVIKRSLSPGFAGIPNPLFGAPNTLMYFADGQKAVLDIVTAMKEL